MWSLSHSLSHTVTFSLQSSVCVFLRLRFSGVFPLTLWAMQIYLLSYLLTLPDRLYLVVCGKSNDSVTLQKLQWFRGQMFEVKAKALRLRLRPKFWSRGHFGHNALTSLIISRWSVRQWEQRPITHNYMKWQNPADPGVFRLVRRPQDLQRVTTGKLRDKYIIAMQHDSVVRATTSHHTCITLWTIVSINSNISSSFICPNASTWRLTEDTPGLKEQLRTPQLKSHITWK